MHELCLLRRPKGRECWTWESRSSGGDPARIIEYLQEMMAAEGYPESDRFAMRLALEEALVNAVKHGNRGDPAKEVRVRFRLDAGRVVARVEDEGEGFDPEQVPDPTAPENIQRPGGGRGLLLMRHHTTSLRFNKRGNRVSLCRRRTGC